MTTQRVEHKLMLLPDKPGCYLMKDINGQIIYVGKAKNLKNRVRSYFKSSHTGKVAAMVDQVADFDIITTDSNKESFLLEITLIQNISLTITSSLSGEPAILTSRSPMSVTRALRLPVR